MKLSIHGRVLGPGSLGFDKRLTSISRFNIFDNRCAKYRSKSVPSLEFPEVAPNAKKYLCINGNGLANKLPTTLIAQRAANEKKQSRSKKHRIGNLPLAKMQLPVIKEELSRLIPTQTNDMIWSGIETEAAPAGFLSPSPLVEEVPSRTEEARGAKDWPALAY